jgi:hypothetical protein
MEIAVRRCDDAHVDLSGRVIANRAELTRLEHTEQLPPRKSTSHTPVAELPREHLRRLHLKRGRGLDRVDRYVDVSLLLRGGVGVLEEGETSTVKSTVAGSSM